MSTDRRIPSPRCCGISLASLLQIDLFPMIDDVQVIHRMQHILVLVNDRTRSFADDAALIVNQRKPCFVPVLQTFDSVFQQLVEKIRSEQKVKQHRADKSPRFFGHEEGGIGNQQRVKGKNKEQGARAAVKLLDLLIVKRNIAHIPLRHQREHIQFRKRGDAQQDTQNDSDECRLELEKDIVIQNKGNPAEDHDQHRIEESKPVKDFILEIGKEQLRDAEANGYNQTGRGSEKLIDQNKDNKRKQTRQYFFQQLVFIHVRL